MKRVRAAVAAGLCMAACKPQELVLRRSSVDWDGFGIAAVAVQATPATGDLEPLAGEAAELLVFALRQSAVSVATAAPDVPRLEVTVKDVALEDDAAEPTPSPDGKTPPKRIVSIREELGYPRLAQRVVRATVLVRLIQPGGERPLWFKEAIGSIDLGGPRGALFPGSDPFPTAQGLDQAEEARALEFYRSVALRRALKQVADDLLPHYEYRELR